MTEVDTKKRNRVVFRDSNEIDTTVELKLKRRFGKGIFVDKWDEATDGSYVIQLGIIVPKDVSDCREPDRVLKFISYKPVYNLTAEPNGDSFIIELPDRSKIQEGFSDRKRELAQRLDTSVARTIYSELAQFTAVEQQLGAVKMILWVVREKHPVSEEEIYDMRGRDSDEQTKRYLQVLKDTQFIEDTDEGVMPAENLRAHDEHSVESDEFSELVLGQIVHRAYSTLRDELNLTLLQHYPKFAGAYYFSALQKDDPNLELDSHAILQNLRTVYDDTDTHQYELEKKLSDLVRAGVVRHEGMYFKADPDVYSKIRAQANV